jgi:tetratricopeptide (TPR) repeat protein
MAGDWRAMMRAADEARRRLIVDEERGIELFAALLAQHPADGMIFFKRGEGFEALGRYDAAQRDYQQAMLLFPMPQWQSRAREGLERVQDRGSQTDATDTPF